MRGLGPFSGPRPEVRFPPPHPGESKKGRMRLGRLAPGAQGAGLGLPRAPALQSISLLMTDSKPISQSIYGLFPPTLITSLASAAFAPTNTHEYSSAPRSYHEPGTVLNSRVAPKPIPTLIHLQWTRRLQVDAPGI